MIYCNKILHFNFFEIVGLIKLNEKLNCQAGDVVQVVERLCSKHKALSLNPGTSEKTEVSGFISHYVLLTKLNPMSHEIPEAFQLIVNKTLELCRET
jgi:hypothetical protein